MDNQATEDQWLKEELELKAAQEIHNLIRKHKSAMITSAQLQTGIQTVFAVTGGLLSDDTFNEISEIVRPTAELRDNSHEEKRMLLLPEKTGIKLIVFKRVIGENQYVIYSKPSVHTNTGEVEWKKSVLRDQFNFAEGELAALDDMNSVIEGFKKRGFVEI